MSNDSKEAPLQKGGVYAWERNPWCWLVKMERL
jgi:hypothetical protein